MPQQLVAGEPPRAIGFGIGLRARRAPQIGGAIYTDVVLVLACLGRLNGVAPHAVHLLLPRHGFQADDICLVAARRLHGRVLDGTLTPIQGSCTDCLRTLQHGSTHPSRAVHVLLPTNSPYSIVDLAWLPIYPSNI